MIRFVCGPRASGKTRHAEALRAHFGCTSIVDDWETFKETNLPDGALVLTQAHPIEIHERFSGRYPKGGIRTTPIKIALRAIGAQS